MSTEISPKELTKPTIHLNGSSARSLCEEYCEAIDAIGIAIEKLAKSIVLA